MSTPHTTAMPIMSSSQHYPTLSYTMNHDQLCGDLTPALMSSESYAPNSYAFNNPYLTPFPSSTVDSTQWMPTSYARHSIPDSTTATFDSSLPSLPNSMERPRSSPSTFGPTPDTVSWPLFNPLGIQYGTPVPQSHSSGSIYTPSTFPNYPTTPGHFGMSSPPEIKHPQPRRSYPKIAPNPAGIAAQKRRRDEDGESARSKRRRTTSVVSADLSEDDQYLVQLKEEENLPWKDIANRFGTDRGRSVQVAALQMRYKRLREKFRLWEDQDVAALKSAYEYWEKYKWEIISAKMPDFGIEERWPARQCARKWQELDAMALVQSTAAGFTPGTQYSSPVDPPMHFAFVPLQ